MPDAGARVGIAAEFVGERTLLTDFLAVDVRQFALAARVLAIAELEALVFAIFERGHDVTAVEHLAGGD